MQDRITFLKKIYSSIDEEVLKSDGLSLEMANLMIENWIGIISLPLGLGLNFDINGEKYSIPMAIEEPSVIAAASSVVKFISDKGSGFKMHATDPIMVAQIQIIGVNYDSLKYVIEEKKYDLIKEANTHWIVMVKRGGGVKALRHRKHYEIDTDDELKDIISIELLVDVKESMGMNVCNTISEKIRIWGFSVGKATIWKEFVSCGSNQYITKFWLKGLSSWDYRRFFRAHLVYPWFPLQEVR